LEWFTEILPRPPIAADNGLDNGLNMLYQGRGGGSYSSVTFTPGKKHRIRLGNTSFNRNFKIWIDQHVMTVMAADFVLVEPRQTGILDIAIGN
jgi:FtsP/CotA-like multicopper oxidase with cupredoxin domain